MPSPRPPRSATATAFAAAVGMFRAPAVHAVAAAVVDANRAEGGLHALAEAEHDLRSAACSSWAPRAGDVASSTACAEAAGAARASARAASSRHRDRGASDHQPPSPRPRALDAACGDARPRPASRPPSDHRPNAIPAPTGKPPPCFPTQVSVPRARPGRPPTSSGTFQSNTFVRLPSSLTWGGTRVRHPVDAMVVPGEPPRAVDRLPVGRGLRGGVRGHGHALGEAIVVEVVAGRAVVDRHGPVGGDPHVGLAAVALHDHGLAAAVLQLEAVVVVDDLHVDPLQRRASSAAHLGAEVRISLMCQRGRSGHAQQRGRNSGRSP